MKAILVDDERDSLEILEWTIQKFAPQVEILAMCESPLDAAEKIQALKPDLVFLDIEMPRSRFFSFKVIHQHSQLKR